MNPVLLGIAGGLIITMAFLIYAIATAPKLSTTYEEAFGKRITIKDNK